MVQRKWLGLTSFEYLTLLYIVITTVMIMCMWNELTNPQSMLLLRLMAVMSMSLAVVLARTLSRFLPPQSCRWFCRIPELIRITPTLVLLIWWYPEIFEFVGQYEYLDHVFADIDQTLFGIQPSLAFELAMPQALWSELFCMGYYAYYYMMAAVIIWYLFRRHDQLDRIGFIFFASFFILYFVYEFLPVAGPQFYFMALLNRGDIVSVENTASFSTLFAEGFPQLGHYFQHHRDMLTPEVQGVFGQLVVSAHEIGERPIAAFPSSHVGISTILMIMVWNTRNRWFFWVMFPVYILLCCGTVYIKAHYLIDSIAGFITAILLYYLTDRVYTKFVKS